ncbi:RNA polymerase sigma factor SigI [uncultured Mycobacterium sp.]|uniref:RNA polymerase sigma factor SigI n=1 Tax=uncultured Mycobacterium sp. TaxID=171292 RepID=UPI0035CC6833
MFADESFDLAWKTHRAFLVDLAFRIVGDIGVAEDVVQEAFFRLMQTRLDEIDDERGWLIVVTSRLCLDYVKSASTRRERPEDMAAPGHRERPSASIDPADRVTLDDELRLALLVVMERLTPAERVVFVLHDIFQQPFDVIALTVGRPSTACRQLASRARRKIAQSPNARRTVEPADHQVLTTKFIAACATGNLDELLAVLDPNVTGEVDTRKGLVVVGAERVAENILRFWGRSRTVLVSQPLGVEPAVLAFVNRKLMGVIALTIGADNITKIHVHVDHSTLAPLRAQLFGTA